MRWAPASGFKTFPLSEVVFKYLDDFLQEGAPPTRAQSFTEALNFAKGHVGLQGVPGALSSRRVHGAVLASFARKDVRKQRSPFTKSEVVSLEFFMVDESASPDMERDKILAGFALFCLYTRTKVGDAGSSASNRPSAFARMVLATSIRECLGTRPLVESGPRSVCP